MPDRIEQLDLLRGMAILGVVAIHTAAETLTDRITFLGIFINQIFRFAVPAFIFLSGLGLSLSKKPYPGYFPFVWRRIRKLLPLYSLWTAVYLVLPVYFAGATFLLSDYFRAIFTGSAAYHLYFVPLIIQFYLLFPLLRKYSSRTSGVLIALALTLTAFVARTYLAGPGWLALGDPRNPLNWLFYFVLGIWCAPRLSSLGRKLKRAQSAIAITLVPCLAGLLIEASANLSLGKGLENSLTQMRPGVLLYSLVFGAWVWVSAWPKAVKSLFRFLSSISYEIYLAHVFVLIEFDHFFFRTGIGQATLIYGVAAFSTVLLVSVFFAVAWRYLVKWSKSAMAP